MKSRRIRKWEGDAREAVDGGPGRGQLTTRPSRGQLAAGQQRGEQQRVGVEPRRGSQHWTPETVGDKIGSSEEDRLKMSAFEVLVEFSLVTHASDSPHMHIVLQYLFSALG